MKGFNVLGGMFLSQRMANEDKGKTLVFSGERTTWISPASLQELLKLKANNPNAPLVVGNTSVGV